MAAVTLWLLTGAAAEAGTRVEWATWSSHGPPVWEGWAIAADPTVIRDGDDYRMVYTAWLPERDRALLGGAVSGDGLLWNHATPVDAENPVSVALDGVEGAWDAQLETAFALERDGEILLYYSGYADPEPDPFVPAADLGLARSTDGIHFTRLGPDPILVRTPGWYDNDAIYSPAVVWWGDRAWMVFAGHCWAECTEVEPGLRILGATSDDGIAWSKHPDPVAEGPAMGLGWATAGVAEPALVHAPDDLFYLFFSAFSGEDGEEVVIGVARAPHPFGPWDVNPTPVVATSDPTGWEGTEVIAPDVLIEDDRVRLWYHGLQSSPEDFRVGCAEAPWPLMEIRSDWRRSLANPLLVPMGDLGDGRTDLAVADPTVIFDERDGLFKAWFSTTVEDPEGDGVMGIRYAESPDGEAWTVQEELAITAAVDDPLAWDHTHTETPFVIKIPTNPPERRYLLYYAGGNLDQEQVGYAPLYQVGLAFSADGKSFTRISAGESPYGEAGLVVHGRDVFPGLDDLGRGLVADPTLLLDSDGTLRLWMSSYAEDTDGQILAFGISHASSSDGIHWTPSAANPLPTLRRPGEIASGQQPSVLWNPRLSRYEMWFTSDREQDTARVPATFFQAFGFWHATSPDGIEWTPEYGDEPDFRWDPVFPSERWGLLTGVDVLLHEGEFRLYYSGWSSVETPPLFWLPTQVGLVNGVTAFGLATRPAAPTRRPSGRRIPGGSDVQGRDSH